MELKVIEQSKNKLVIDIPGEDHTLFNILSKELMSDKDVTLGGYYVEHPVLNVPRLIIQTKPKTPFAALEEAVKRVKKLNSDFSKAVEKALK